MTEVITNKSKAGYRIVIYDLNSKKSNTISLTKNGDKLEDLSTKIKNLFQKR